MTSNILNLADEHYSKILTAAFSAPLVVGALATINTGNLSAGFLVAATGFFGTMGGLAISREMASEGLDWADGMNYECGYGISKAGQSSLRKAEAIGATFGSSVVSGGWSLLI